MKLCILTNLRALISNTAIVFFNFWLRSTQIRNFWSQTHLILHEVDKFEGVDFKYDKCFLNSAHDGGKGRGGGGVAKRPPIPVSPKTFWLLVLTLLSHWCKISSSYLVLVPNYWNWTKTTPQKKRFFWSNPYKVEVMITFLIEMPELPKFGQVTTSTI